MQTLKIHGWERWQSYRADRGQPPWIKLHREVMRHIEWVTLTDAQRGQLVAIWLLAADRNGVVPASPDVIKKLCHMDTVPDLNLFIKHGFIDGDAIVTPECRQHDQPEKSREETETETETDIPVANKVGRHTCPDKEILALYHKILPELPSVKFWTQDRIKALRIRWDEDASRQSLEFWEQYFGWVRNFPFYMGENKDSWRADIDFLLRKKPLEKMLEREIV